MNTDKDEAYIDKIIQDATEYYEKIKNKFHKAESNTELTDEQYESIKKNFFSEILPTFSFIAQFMLYNTEEAKNFLRFYIADNSKNHQSLNITLSKTTSNEIKKYALINKLTHEVIALADDKNKLNPNNETEIICLLEGYWS